MNDPRRLMRASFVFLFSSTEELGFDPTVRFYESHNEPAFFAYGINDTTDKQTRYLKLLSLISSHHPVRITGRDAQVRRVIKVNSFENP